MTLRKAPIDLNKWFVPLLCLNLVVWVLARVISDSNLDPYGDMLENFAWGQEFSWGNQKHPPLIGWITGLWFWFMPRYDTSYHLLAYLNVLVGLVGIYRVAGCLDLKKIAIPSVLLLAMAFPYSTLAVKFNANSILLSLWPWVIFGWLKCQQEAGSKGVLWAIIFGAMSALALLGKYYSGVLMIGLLLASFSSVQGRLWLRSFKPWLAGLVFCLMLAPHVLWLFDNHFVSLQYISTQSNGKSAYRELYKFALAPLFYWLLPWVACAWLSSFGAPSLGLRIFAFIKNLGRAWYCRDWDDTLFWLVMLPWILTLVIGATGFVHLSLPWAIPLGFGFPLLWLRNLWGLESASYPHLYQYIPRVFSVWLILVVIVSPLYAWQQGVSENRNYYLPRAEAARAILAEWQQRVPGSRLHWVGGNWAENALVAFYGDPDVTILPGLPDSNPGYASNPDEWRGNPGLLLCPGKLAAVPSPRTCHSEIRSWLLDNDLAVREFRVSVKKTGLRFPADWEFEYTGFIYLPGRGESDHDS